MTRPDKAMNCILTGKETEYLKHFLPGKPLYLPGVLNNEVHHR